MNRSLYELQEADSIVVKLKRERGKLDDGLHARSERDTLARAHDAERTRLSLLNTNRTDRELQLKSAEEKIARQQSRLMQATSTHEVTALQRDIKALESQRGDFDEAILNLMDEIEQSMERVAKLESDLLEKTVAASDVEAHFSQQTQRLEAELEQAHIRREQIAATLSGDELEKYDDSARAHNGIAVAHPDKGNCSGCGMAFTPFNLRGAKSQQWPTCESCGRLLFIE